MAYTQDNQTIPLLKLGTKSTTYPASTYAESIASTINPLLSFKSTITLKIAATGKSFISLPLPASQLAIPILSQLTSRSKYLSVRPEKRSGSYFLTLADYETQSSIARTKYRFGSGKPPEVHIGADDDLASQVFSVESQGIVSRSVGFAYRGEKYRWRYAGRKERSAEVKNLLVLENQEGERIARLVRGEGTRMAGTKARDAGNGGVLEIAEVGGEMIVVVVITALVMLKKEIDRLRGRQLDAMAAAGAIGGQDMFSVERCNK